MPERARPAAGAGTSVVVPLVPLVVAPAGTRVVVIAVIVAVTAVVVIPGAGSGRPAAGARVVVVDLARRRDGPGRSVVARPLPEPLAGVVVGVVGGRTGVRRRARVVAGRGVRDGEGLGEVLWSSMTTVSRGSRVWPAAASEPATKAVRGSTSATPMSHFQVRFMSSTIIAPDGGGVRGG